MDLRLGSRLGKYLIQEPLAAGGFGRVYRAIQTGPGGFERTVAIKVLRRSVMERPDGVELLFREARIVALLNHRNIVQVHEFAEELGVYFLVMEHVDGLPLSRLDPDHEGLPSWLAAGIAAEVARALTYAHNLRDPRRALHGVIHRDIKPSNVLISTQGEVKVSDFGLGKMLGTDPASAIGVKRGTPAYMSPEQLRGEPATPGSDVFALGLLVLRLCRGTIPPRQGAATTMPAQQLEACCDPALLPIVSAALQAQAGDRPDAKALEDALTACAVQLAPSGAHLSDELVRRVQVSSDDAGSRGKAAGTVSLPQKEPGLAPQLGPGAGEGSPPTPDSSTLVDRPGARRAGYRLAVLLAGMGVAGLIVLVVAQRSEPDPSKAPAADGGVGLDLALLSPAVDGPLAADATSVADVGRDPRRLRRKRRGSSRPGTVGKPGFFSVNTRPWTTVTIDGARVGITPLYRLPVASGRHRVGLVAADGRRVERVVIIEPERELNLGLIAIDR